MPKPTIPDLTGSGLSQSAYLDLWTEVVKAVLPAAIQFHGCDAGSHGAGVDHVALMADAVMEARIARVLQAKEDADTAREDASKTKDKGKK